MEEKKEGAKEEGGKRVNRKLSLFLKICLKAHLNSKRHHYKILGPKALKVGQEKK